MAFRTRFLSRHADGKEMSLQLKREKQVLFLSGLAIADDAVPGLGTDSKAQPKAAPRRVRGAVWWGFPGSGENTPSRANASYGMPWTSHAPPRARTRRTVA